MISLKNYTKTKYNNICNSKYIFNLIPKSVGNTIGNSLRRSLLTRSRGTAIYAYSLSCFQHEFDYSQYLVEDAGEIMLRIKDVVIKNIGKTSEGVIEIKIKGPCVIKADILNNDKIIIGNPDLLLFNISTNTELIFKIFYRTDVGFSLHIENNNIVKELITNIDESSSIIGTTAIYSKVINANFNLIPDSFNDMLEELIIDIEYYDIYDEEHHLIKEAIDDISDILSQIKNSLFKKEEKVEKPKYNYKQELLKHVQDSLIEKYTIAAYSALSKLEFENIEELKEKHLGNIINYKNLGIKKLQYKTYIKFIIPLIESLETKN